MKQPWLRMQRAAVRMAMDEVEQLIGQLEHGNPGDGVRAAEALGKIGDERAVAPLVAALKLFREPAVAHSLAVPAVVPFVYHDLRRAAARALGEIGNANAIEPLVDAIHDEEVIWVAVDALRKFPGIARAVEPLVERLGRLKSGVSLAEEALTEQIDGSNNAIVLKTVESIKRDATANYDAAAKVIMNVGMSAIDPLMKALINRDRHVREVAAEMLGSLGFSNALPGLKRRLRPFIGERDKGVLLCIRAAIHSIERITGR